VISPGLDDVAFVNPDGSKVLFLYDSAANPITFAVKWDGSQVRYTIPAGATTTFTWR
jgi:glucosylceramidase